ncbi:MAG: hypothetical protein ACXABV_16955 [Candidatus Thorarchaeota archaeon]|jgi:hypothetical protein
MSGTDSGCKIGGVIGLTFCLPLIFVLVLFQFLGIAEYVFPIVIPIFVGTGLVFIFVFGIIMYAVRSATRRTMQLDQSLVRSYDAGMVSSDYMDQYPPGASYEIPVYCPYCQESIELDRVRWIGSSGLVCANCRNQVRIEVSEE